MLAEGWPNTRLLRSLSVLPFDLLTVPLGWLCHRVAQSSCQSAYVVFLIQTADQSLLGVVSR